jgi:hypothetical protein
MVTPGAYPGRPVDGRCPGAARPAHELAMDELVAAAVRGGVCRGAALAAHAEAADAHPDDPDAAVLALAAALAELRQGEAPHPRRTTTATGS